MKVELKCKCGAEARFQTEYTWEWIHEDIFKWQKRHQNCLALEKIQKLRLKSGDILTISFSKLLSLNAIENIQSGIRPILDKAGLKDVKIMVLEEDLKLGIIHREEL